MGWGGMDMPKIAPPSPAEVEMVRLLNDIDREMREKLKVNVKIWGEAPKVAPAIELRLRLKQDGDSVLVYAVDEDGNPIPSGNLVCFDSKQGFWRCPGVNTAIGLDLDKNGRIKDNSVTR